jgi:iron complex outermembrane receptor protein
MDKSSVRIAVRIALSTALLATQAYAEDNRVLEEVIVTAEKKTANVQDVPISMAVVSGEELSSLNIFNFVDTAQLTPGISLNSGLQAAAIRLRGVGPGYFALGQAQSVTVFIDQVAQAQIGAVFSTMVDVERLELLRGPQGTLLTTSPRAHQTSTVTTAISRAATRSGITREKATSIRAALSIFRW